MPDLEVAESLDVAANVTEAEQVEAPVENVEVEQPEQVEQQEEPITEPEDKTLEQNADQKPQAGVPEKYKELFAKDKDLRFAYMGYQALRKEFPGGVKEAREYRDTLNTVGGKEGIAELQADREAITAMDQQLEAGDPKFVDSIASEFGEGFIKLMPRALEVFNEKNPEMYQHVMGRVVFNTINDSPIGDIYKALSASDKPEHKQLAETVANWFNGIRDLAAKVPEKKIDPERQKFEQEKTAFEQKKSEEFKTSVVNEIRMSNAKDLDAELAKQFKANGKDYADFKKKNPEGVTAMLEQAYKNMLLDINKDQTFVDQHNQLLAKQNREKLVSAMRSKSQKAIPDAVKKAYRLFNFGAAPKGPVPNANQNGNNTTLAPKKVGKQPEPHELDWSRMGEEEGQKMLFQNKAYVKGRKELVTW